MKLDTRRKEMVESSEGLELLHIGAHGANKPIDHEFTRQLKEKTKRLVRTDIVPGPGIIIDDITKYNKKFKGKFDKVYMGHVLEHIGNQEEALKNALSYTKRDGCLIVHVPNIFATKRLLAYLINKHRQHPEHCSAYTYITLKQLCERITPRHSITFGNTERTLIDKIGLLFGQRYSRDLTAIMGRK